MAQKLERSAYLHPLVLLLQRMCSNNYIFVFQDDCESVHSMELSSTIIQLARDETTK